MWPFKWKLLRSTFVCCFLLCWRVEILKCDGSNESYWGTVYYVVQGGASFGIKFCATELKTFEECLSVVLFNRLPSCTSWIYFHSIIHVWSFKWKLLSSTLLEGWVRVRVGYPVQGGSYFSVCEWKLLSNTFITRYLLFNIFPILSLDHSVGNELNNRKVFTKELAYLWCIHPFDHSF